MLMKSPSRSLSPNRKKPVWLFVLALCLAILPAGSSPLAVEAATAPSAIAWPTDAETANGSGKWPELADIQCGAYIVLERQSGTVLLEKEADLKLYPASTTKIVTALLGLERLDPEDTVKISAEAVNLPSGYTKVGFKAGEQVVVKDLLAGLMVASGNDAANAVAEAVGGSIDRFAALMNERARKAGATRTNFLNPSGIHQEQHITTARDLALITSDALADSRFRELVSLKTCSMPATNLHPYNGWAILSSTNRLMVFDDSYYASDRLTDIIGVKTGYTNAAGDCLVAAATTEDGTELIGVILKVPASLRDTNKFAYMRTLLEEGAILHDSSKPSPTVTPTPTPAPTIAPTPSTPATDTTQTTRSQTDPIDESQTGSLPTTSESVEPGGVKDPALAGFLEELRVQFGMSQVSFSMAGVIVGILIGTLLGLIVVLSLDRRLFRRRPKARR